MAGRRLGQTRRMVAVVAGLALAAVAALPGPASGEESLSDLRSRLSTIQNELDAAAARISTLEDREAGLEERSAAISVRIEELEDDSARLEKRVVRAANILYRTGQAGMLQVLFSAPSFGALTARAEMLAAISQHDASAFIEYERTSDELAALREELEERSAELAATRDDIKAESARLQDSFEQVSAEYEDLKDKLAAAAAARTNPVTAGGSAPIVAPAFNSRGKACPVAGPVSFVDTWGAPRSGGRTHEGVDMMAAYGTPVVAITSGTITFSGYGSSAGNWIALAGADGHAYWYMHLQSIMVGSGRVSTGQQIGTVGDTGNAAGTPHLHFEYHPGGGGPVNPYPLVASIC